ncbi:ABC transporter permease [Brachybacterium sp. JHP9]|uniref:Oligopeptide transport system permease protein OppC n=1 Tax=Brachybacterium equifaecis TaxID=2910770 RepID=A0ABT0QZD7_9MICO|nr:ABC transporter permease [Brachybacterium equifaecis]MCL6422981.1 ABC transporter permease [Brachybacterium equifaecis]
MSVQPNMPADQATELPRDLEPSTGAAGSLPNLTTGKRTRAISRNALVWRRLKRKPNFWIGASIVLLIILFALFGNIPNIYAVGEQDPYGFNAAPGAQHWFGADAIGVDLYASMTAALRKSLLIGFIAAPVATIIAAFIGSLAGYLGGIFESVTNWIVNLLLVLPVFYVLMIVSPLMSSQSWLILVVAIGGFSWMVMSQIVKNQTKTFKEREFVLAARYMGVSTFTILTRHIIPNVSSLLIIDAALGVSGAILAETSLSFFGLGIQAPDVSLGTLLQDGSSAAVSRPWLFIFPAAFLVTLLTAVALMGDALRDALDPTSGTDRS